MYQDTKEPNDKLDYKYKSRHTSGSSSCSSSCSSSEDSITLPTPPDGGWGWVVVLGSFLVHIIADGCAFSFGVFYVELLDYFKESKGKTAWVGSLFVSVPLITGPIASAVTNRYGCREATIVGGFTAGLGFVASAYVNSIEGLCLTFGIISGFGLSLVYVPAVVIVAYYFEEKRAFATGIAVAGSGIGTFLFAPMTEYLIEAYSWRGAILIIGGIMFNIMACGALFRPLVSPKALRKKRLEMSLEKSVRHSSRMEEYNESRSMYSENHHLQALLEQLEEPVAHSLVQFPTYLEKELNSISPDLLKDLHKNGMTLRDALRDQGFRSHYLATQSIASNRDLEAAEETSDLGEQDMVHASNTDDSLNNLDEPENVVAQSSVMDKSDQVTSNDETTNAHTNHTGDMQHDVYAVVNSNGKVNHISKPHHRRHIIRPNLQGNHYPPMSRKDIFYRGSLVRNGLFTQGGRAASCPDIILQNSDSSSEDLDESLWVFKLLKFSKEVKHIIKEMLDVAILRSLIFVVFSISCMLLYMWYDVPYVYTPDQASSLGIADSKASFLVSIIGIVSTVGQVVLGYIGDRPWCDATFLYALLTTLAGIATALVPLCTNYALLSIYSASFGFLISANYSLTTIILVDLLSMEKLTNAYGLVMLAEGLANLIGPPLAGRSCVQFFKCLNVILDINLTNFN